MAADREADVALAWAAGHDLPALAAWIAGRPADAPPWEVLAIDATDDPAFLAASIRAALRQDPDALLLGPRGPLDEAVAELVRMTVETGHAVFFRGADPGLAIGEPGAAFLARLPGGRFRAALGYLHLDQAPRPADLEDGFDRYESAVVGLPLGAPPPAPVGAAVGLRLDAVEPWDFEPPTPSSRRWSPTWGPAWRPRPSRAAPCRPTPSP